MTPRFYTEYESISVSYLVYNGGNCVKDQYGFYENPDCDSYASASRSVGGDADLDIHVYYKGRMVYADQFSGFSGHASTQLFWSVDLGAPYCGFGNSFSRSYRAVIRLFDPVTKRVVDHDTEYFGVRCS